MSYPLAISILIASGLYTLIGIFVGGWFVLRRIGRVDPAAAHAPIGFA
ncbi:MAG: hypothetical protein ACREJD_04105 [Phycisphaerales bacterium]